MKDRIGNALAKGDKVLVSLPEAQIFGYVADMEESSLIAPAKGGRGALEHQPGRVLISCVVAVPIHDELEGMVPQLTKVYDSTPHNGETGSSAPN